jgi:Vacuolar sorting protein 9 (VPS9) domain
VCILNCCKVINNLLVNASFASGQNAPGADEFLPVLIYVTIKVVSFSIFFLASMNFKEILMIL